MIEECVDCFLVAVHHAEHTVGKTGVPPQLGNERRYRRVSLRWLQHERVAARDGERKHPHRDHHRKVERRDPGDDPERLTDRVAIGVGRHLLRVSAREQVGNPARELDDFDAARDLAQRVGEHLAVLGGDQRGEIALA